MSASTDEKTAPAPAPEGETKAAPRTRRVRRTGEEARRLILDAAEQRLASSGPEGIRLQDIAKDVGISHPAILHHFQSREGLVGALVERTMTHLRDALLGVITRGQSGALDTDAMMDEVFATLSDRGHARLLAWLTLTGRVEPESGLTDSGDENSKAEGSRGRQMLGELTDLVHEAAARQARDAGKTEPSKEDTRFFILLAAMSAFGEAIVGRQMYEAAGLGGDPEAAAKFRTRLKALLHPVK
ncbi:TetR/AcrR family transcriptional regulator [Pyruvatibacter mobilis]|uniref:TetR/AcrR family transcriptional regulator n=1 Tax=Pyruvatibacter mobilis TaxID=1712261 RepID=UPI003BA8C865